MLFNRALALLFVALGCFGLVVLLVNPQAFYDRFHSDISFDSIPRSAQSWFICFFALGIGLFFYARAKRALEVSVEREAIVIRSSKRDIRIPLSSVVSMTVKQDDVPMEVALYFDHETDFGNPIYFLTNRPEALNKLSATLRGAGKLVSDA